MLTPARLATKRLCDRTELLRPKPFCNLLPPRLLANGPPSHHNFINSTHLRLHDRFVTILLDEKVSTGGASSMQAKLDPRPAEKPTGKLDDALRVRFLLQRPHR